MAENKETKILSWGGNLLTFTTLGSNPESIEIPVPKEGSTQLEVQKGDIQKATVEGGKAIALRQQANGYTLSFQLYYDSALDSDTKVKALLAEGMRDQNYSITLTPENTKALKITIAEASVSVTHSYTSADGIIKNVECEVITSGTEPIKYA